MLASPLNPGNSSVCQLAVRGGSPRRAPDGGRLLVGSHGNLISLVLQAFEPAVDFDFHWAMPMPAIYHLQHDGIGWRVMGGHGFIEAQPLN